MTTYTYPSYPAIDPQTETLARGASGQIYDINDTEGVTPLAITDLNGLPLSEVKTTDQGITAPFRVEDHPEVLWRSGSYVIPLDSPKSIRDAAEASAASSADSATAASSAADAAVASAGTAQAAADAGTAAVAELVTGVDARFESYDATLNTKVTIAGPDPASAQVRIWPPGPLFPTEGMQVGDIFFKTA